MNLANWLPLQWYPPKFGDQTDGQGDHCDHTKPAHKPNKLDIRRIPIWNPFQWLDFNWPCEFSTLMNFIR